MPANSRFTCYAGQPGPCQDAFALLQDGEMFGIHVESTNGVPIVIERALLRLPVEQRAAVVAVDMQGYSVAETAAMLGIAEGTVKSRCSRARAKLAQSLAHLSHSAD